MAAPTPTSISTVAVVIPPSVVIGESACGGTTPPTTGQLWPRGNVS